MVSISELDPKSKMKNLSCKPSITLVSKCLTYLIAQILYTQEVYSEIYFYYCNNLQLSGPCGQIDRETFNYTL